MNPRAPEIMRDALERISAIHETSKDPVERYDREDLLEKLDFAVSTAREALDRAIMPGESSTSMDLGTKLGYQTTTTMKKILAVAALTALSVSAFGQGQIQFNNRVTTTTPAVDAPIYWFPPIPLSGTNTSFRAALIGGSTAGIPTTVDGLGTLNLLASPTTGATWVTFRTGAAAGYIAVGTDSARDSGLPYNSMGLFQVVAWQGTQNTWAEAYAASRGGQIHAGWSNPILAPVTTGPTDLAVPSLIGLNSFWIALPEPSSFALAGLGAAALLIFRREKPTPGHA